MSRISIMHRVLLSGLLAISICISPSYALDSGDWIVRVGAANVSPNDDSHGLSSDPTAEVGVENDTSLGVTVSYMYSRNFGVGVLAAWPFEHDLSGHGSLRGAGTIIETKQLPPTVTAQYHFLPHASIRPFIGGGVNYTHFFSTDTTGPLNGIPVDLENSWGFAAELGVDIDITKQWAISGQLWYLNIDTTAKLGGGLGRIDVDIDPWVLMIGASWKL